MTDASTSSAEAAEVYREKLVDWMISQDIPTGSNGDRFEDLLEVLATYIETLKKQNELISDHQ
jgi:hypothetical protein